MDAIVLLYLCLFSSPDFNVRQRASNDLLQVVRANGMSSLIYAGIASKDLEVSKRSRIVLDKYYNVWDKTGYVPLVTSISIVSDEKFYGEFCWSYYQKHGRNANFAWILSNGNLKNLFYVRYEIRQQLSLELVDYLRDSFYSPKYVRELLEQAKMYELTIICSAPKL